MRAPDQKLPKQEIDRLWANEGECLRKWTLKELKAQDREYDRELEEAFDIERESYLQELEDRNWAAMAATMPTLTEIKKHYILWIIRSNEPVPRGAGEWAPLSRDEKARLLDELIDKHPELARFALKARMQKPRRGRQKGEPRPADYPDNIREAKDCKARVRNLWWRRLGKRNRGTSPTADEIAAEYMGVPVEQLIGFSHNSGRSRRR